MQNTLEKKTDQRIADSAKTEDPMREMLMKFVQSTKQGPARI